MKLKSSRRISPRISIWRLILTLMVTSVVGQKMSKEAKNEKQTMSFCYQPQELDLTRAQRMDCRQHPAAFKYSLIGLKRAEEECKRLLIKNTWNCTGLISQTQKSLERHDRTSIMSKSYQETAFANAMIAAGITYEITKACIKGQIDDVKGSCPRKTSKNYYKDFYVQEDPEDTTNCIDKCVTYAAKRAEAFQERSPSKHYELARKNQKVGERLVFKSRRENCRCMGPSGSCTWKYCVKSIESFSKIASNLYSKYRERGSLKKITYDMHGQSRPDINRITDRTLVYNSHLDICSETEEQKAVTIINRNRGRLCKLPRDNKKTSKRTTVSSRRKRRRNRRNHLKKHLGKCDTICCNKSYKEIHRVEKFKHNMKFSWNKKDPISWDVRERNVTYGVCT